MSFSFISLPFGQHISKYRTYLRLGLSNLLSVFVYRLAIKLQFFRRVMKRGGVDTPSLALFTVDDLPASATVHSSSMVEEADELLKGNLRCFSHNLHHYGTPPDWFLNPFNHKRYGSAESHWSELGDFNNTIGDIKCIWEISRFDWVLVLACAFSQTGKKKYITTANNWASDWFDKNRLYCGPNWKCGQEVSIRMMQVLLASFILGQHVDPEDGLVQFVIDHAERIFPTMFYAIAQDNNHGTSEATALFVAGTWLLTLDSVRVDQKKAHRWQHKGRKWLENRVVHLVEDDGSFSQYSVNYHRVLIDTLCYAEFWRKLLHAPPFSKAFYRKARAATKWMFTFTNSKNGDVPNIGANDGARLFTLGTSDYRDYRPSVQLASRLFMNKPAYPPGCYDESLDYLRMTFSDAEHKPPYMEKKSRIFPDGGYCYLSSGKTEVYTRYPVFQFRPGQADALHVDLWFEGENVIRDAGTYSYNAEEKLMKYFSGTEAHSTVEFDGRDQMVRVSRFLFANWLEINHLSTIQKAIGGVTWSAGYFDSKGAEHRRTIVVSDNRVFIKDQVKGFSDAAVIRWRLNPVRWTLNNNLCSSDIASIKVATTAANQAVQILTGYESRYYQEKSSLPVLTIEVKEECEVMTEIELHPTGKMEKD